MSVSITRCALPGSASRTSFHEERLTPGNGEPGAAASVVTTARSAGQLARTGRSSVSRSGLVTSTRTSQSRKMNATCSGLSSGFSGTNTPPAAGAPKLAITVSKRFSRKIATRSARCRPI